MPTEIKVLPSGQLRKIFVNQKNIKTNIEKSTCLPTVGIECGEERLYAHNVKIEGPSEVVYSAQTIDGINIVSVRIHTEAQLILEVGESEQIVVQGGR